MTVGIRARLSIVGNAPTRLQWKSQFAGVLISVGRLAGGHPCLAIECAHGGTPLHLFSNSAAANTRIKGLFSRFERNALGVGQAVPEKLGGE